LNLKQKIRKLWNTRFNEPLTQMDLKILLEKKGQNYRYIKQNQDGTISFKIIPLTKFMGSYSHKKKQSQTKFNPNQLITDSTYIGIPKYSNYKQLSHMGITSKYLDKGKTFPSKYFLSQAKNILFSLKKKQTQSIPQYQQRLRIIQNEQSPRFRGRARPLHIQQTDFLLISPNIHTAKILYPIRPLTNRQMNNIKQQEQIQNYDQIQNYLFRQSLNDIINDENLQLEQKIQLCHLNKMLKNMIAEHTAIPLDFLEAERIRRIIKSLQSEIEFPEHGIIIPPLTENQIIDVLNALDFLIENIPNRELLMIIMNT
jgi:hypothetical protein